MHESVLYSAIFGPMSRSVFFASIVVIGLTPALADSPAWVAKSNQNARVLLEIIARYSPESAGRYGVNGLDDRIVDLSPKSDERRAREVKAAGETLRARLQSETDPLVRQDLEILIDAARKNVRDYELNEKYYIPYVSVPRSIYGGIHSLLDDQVAADRRPAALARLRRYAGMERGLMPLVTLAERRTREKLNNRGLLGPATAEVEKDLAATRYFVDGVGELFEKYKIAGYQEPFAMLKEQMAAYDDF